MKEIHWNNDMIPLTIQITIFNEMMYEYEMKSKKSQEMKTQFVSQAVNVQDV